MTEVVRKDVHGAQMASVQLQIDMLTEAAERDRADKTADRRAVRNAGVTAALSVGVAILMLIIQLVIK